MCLLLLNLIVMYSFIEYTMCTNEILDQFDIYKEVQFTGSLVMPETVKRMSL